MSDQKTKTAVELTRVQELTENPTYIKPPRAFLFSRLIRMWSIIFVGAALSIDFLAFIFVFVDALVLFRYKTTIHLWGIYYNKLLLAIFTILLCLVGYLFRYELINVIWSIMKMFELRGAM